MKLFARKLEGAQIESYIFWNYIKTKESKIFILAIWKFISFSYVKHPKKKMRIQLKRWYGIKNP